MSTLDIKLEIFDKLKEVEDIALLNRIMNLLKNTDQTEDYHLNEDELNIIRKSEDDITAGNVISQKQLDKEDLEWLSKL
ncbi:hypothetical protein [Flavobacterium caseinilyticum]|uniref:Addiction module protein n=1 Tax=Flavobacterium caseinilyticum TaxID=2541732 RepID=A0A4R5B3J2_9FLAO|nr:hypothetical protein [Flavobacterium caseinilyticum]TDD78796.1 hypothetical protein E0F89_03970 [Flavobacterium caseinilyticum]